MNEQDPDGDDGQLRDGSRHHDMGAGGGKLRSQRPGKDVIVHQADPRYEHHYRMRETSDHEPILVPEYRFSGTYFPHRNSLSNAPQPILHLQPPDSPTGSILRRPPSAVLRSPLHESFPPQGDFTGDTRPPSPTHHFTPNRQRSESRTPIISITPSLAADSVTSLPSHLPHHTPQNRDSLQPPSLHLRTPSPAPSRRSSWLSAILPPRFRPDRPQKFTRRSLTPRLYNAHEVALDAQRDRPGYPDDEYEREMKEERRTQREAGMLLIALCVLFPPLWFVVAAGGMDGVVAGVTGGKVKAVGRREKRVAGVLGAVVGGVCVVAVVVGVSVAVTTR
ncbi:hypothetical protein EX30DRAFT_374446 [Ascodesmis nigricans]|uniref:Uncharacterized protein n=1 Tax=Ascodesmis nigricans TaxID=341454 RepID=A0A4S2MKV6_9PEZI|nr:hypothetical protein EX30DRAFT_374446 [Ascodesmis nigricans]